jgi:hypothetical protein
MRRRKFTERGLRNKRRNREDFAGLAVEDDIHVFVASAQRKIRRQEADFGFVDGIREPLIKSLLRNAALAISMSYTCLNLNFET